MSKPIELKKGSAVAPLVSVLPTTSIRGKLVFYIVDGHIYVDNGTILKKVLLEGDVSGTVTSIFGRVGAVIAVNGDYTASNITNVPAGSIAAVTVQNALNELDTEKAPVSDGVSQNSINALNDVTITAPAVDELLKYNGAQWINSNINLASAGSGVMYFFTNDASDIATFEVLSKTPDAGGEVDESQAVTNQTIEFERYITPSGGLGGTSIDAGLWNFNVYAYVSDATDTSELLLDVYSRATDGTETLLFSLTTGNIDSTSVSLYDIRSVQQAFAIAATDRLVVRVSAKTNSLAAKTVHFVHSGTSHNSNITTPLVIRHNELIGLQGGNATERYHLTSAQVVAVAALGTISSQNANNVAITGGAISGITDLAVADGGTGASLAATALSNLGGVPLTRLVNNKALSADITLALASADFVNQGSATTLLHGNAAGNPSFGAVVTDDITAKNITYAKIQDVSATDKVLGRASAGAGVVEEIACTAAGRAILDDASAADQRTTLGLGTIATQAANNVAITGGSITGITDLAIADGGTGSSTAIAARLALGVTDANDRMPTAMMPSRELSHYFHASWDEVTVVSGTWAGNTANALQTDYDDGLRSSAGYRYNNSDTNNDEIHFGSLTLNAGTYLVKVTTIKAVDACIMEVLLGTTSLGTSDLYSVASVYNSVVSFTYSPSTRVSGNLRLKVSGHNAGSAEYLLRFSRLEIIRTG